MPVRNVDVAVGFTDHTWHEVSIEVPEEEDRVLDEDEISEQAIAMVLPSLAKRTDISFVHIMYIEDPDGGFAED